MDDPTLTTETDLLLYFRFSRASFVSNVIPIAFTNNGITGAARLAYRDSTLRTVTFRNSLFMTNESFNYLSGMSQKGTINEIISFDGYTCLDSSEKLYFPTSNSYARGQL